MNLSTANWLLRGEPFSKHLSRTGGRCWKTRKCNKLRWYPYSRNFFLFTNLSEACCEAKRWNLLRNPVEPDLAAPKPPPKPSPERCWTWPGSAPKPPRPSPEPSEPFPELRWIWPGACTSAHRSYSGLKTPFAYAVGEKIVLAIASQTNACSCCWWDDGMSIRGLNVLAKIMFNFLIKVVRKNNRGNLKPSTQKLFY